MPTTATRESGNFEKAPTGMQQAVCSFVNDIGKQMGEYMGEPKISHKVIITWELAEKKTQGNSAGEPFLVSKFYTLSLNEKANLCKDLESWRGKSFTEDELKGFDLEKLIGANCFLNITESKNDGRIVSAVTPIAKGMTKIERKYSAMPDGFAKWVQGLKDKAVHDAGTQEDDVPLPDETKGDLPF